MSKAISQSKKDEESKLASYWQQKFKEAMVHKAPYTKKWQDYLAAYNGEYFSNSKLPDYRSDFVSNYIFATVETIRPIMVDNDPKFQAMPRQSEGMDYAADIQQALMYEFDREKMNGKLYRELINTLTIGNAVFFLPYDSLNKQIKCTTVNPFNIFPNPTATCMDDAEYIIYANYMSLVDLRERFPERAKELVGGGIEYEELANDTQMSGHIDNQVLILEVWTKDYDLYEEGDSDTKKVKRKYPTGRTITIVPSTGMILSDVKNPYKDDRFPFFIMKCYDLPGKFWGEGEVSQLISPQSAMNELSNAIIDNAKMTANMPWLVDNNSGIKQGSITSRPGLIIRKNPGSEVTRPQPPSMPPYVRDTVEIMKSDIEMISGVFASMRGDRETGVYTAQGILAIQEAGNTRIRLKVKLMEEFLGELATSWVSRMQQFWKDDKWVAVTKYEGQYDMKKFQKDSLLFDYDVKISAGSTMPVNRSAMLDLMLRLAQTPMPDGMPLVDREAVLSYLPEEGKSAILERMKGENVQLQQLQQQMQEMQQMVQESMQQLGQQLGQLAEESKGNDEQTFAIIEEITSAIEKIQQEILQLQEKHDIMEQEQIEEQRTEELKSKAYNEGFKEAESIYSDRGMEEQDQFSGLQTDEEFAGEVPDDVLSMLESMSDEELEAALQQNPEMADLI